MKELIEHLRANGFDLAEPQLDGRVHRFRRDAGERKLNSWFWGVEGFANTNGQPYTIAIYGDWSTGEKHEYRSTDALSGVDRAAINTQIAEARKKAEIAKARAQKDTAEEAVKTLEAAIPAKGHPYLGRKQIKPHGTFLLDGVLLVPMRDIDGRLWGLQRIDVSGRKLFLAGQRTKELFHVIPDSAILARESKILFCEGFATGASLYEATGFPVVVCFSASNLVDVVRLVVKEAPEAAHLICGDDDRNTEGNPGQEKAKEAAVASGAQVVFPQFLKSDEESTDFNDVHVTRGLVEVTAQIDRVRMVPQWVRPLGMVKHQYVMVSSSNSSVFITNGFDKMKLFHLMPKEYWESRYPKEKGGGADFDKIASKYMAECRAMGGVDLSRVVGSGVYEDSGELVIHMGNRLWVRGREIGLFDYRGKNIYERDTPWPKTPTGEYTAEEGRAFLSWLNLTTLENPFMADLYLGLMGSQLLCGALPHRTHAAFWGSSGNGKTTLGRKLPERILPPNSVFVGAGSSEAGIRQSIGNRSSIVVIDEMEGGTRNDVERIEAILNYARESFSGGAITKGSSDSSGAMQYQTRSSIWAIAIQDFLHRQSDETRFVRIGFRQAREGDTPWKALRPFMDALSADTGIRMLLRLINRWERLKDTAADFSDAINAKTRQRVGDKYAWVLAARHWLCNDTPECDIPAMIAGIPEMDDVSDEHDGDACLEWLLNARAQLGTETTTFRHLVIAENHQALATYGMSLEFYPKRLIVPYSSPDMRRIFEGTDWARGYAKAILRVAGAKMKRGGSTGKRPRRIEIEITPEMVT